MSKSHREVSPRLRNNARKLRGEQTDAERSLWQLLRSRRLGDFNFRRQVPFQNYILDFVCHERRLVVEVDGGQHGDNVKDEARDRALAREGYKVVRYWNTDVLRNSDGVLTDLLAHLRGRTPHPAPRFARRHPLPQGEREGNEP